MLLKLLILLFPQGPLLITLSITGTQGGTGRHIQGCVDKWITRKDKKKWEFLRHITEYNSSVIANNI